MGESTCSGEEKGWPIPKPSTNTPGRGRPQIRVGVESLGQGPADCSGLAGKETASASTPSAVAGAMQAAQRSGVCYPGITAVLKFYLKKETTIRLSLLNSRLPTL
jgi:hypothetical protein